MRLRNDLSVQRKLIWEEKNNLGHGNQVQNTLLHTAFNLDSETRARERASWSLGFLYQRTGAKSLSAETVKALHLAYGSVLSSLSSLSLLWVKPRNQVLPLPTRLQNRARKAGPGSCPGSRFQRTARVKWSGGSPGLNMQDFLAKSHPEMTRDYIVFGVSHHT